MSWYTEEEIEKLLEENLKMLGKQWGVEKLYTDYEKLLEDEELRKRIARFVTMSGEEFFDEVYTHLSPEELEEYLEENPSERKYLKRYEP